MSDSIYVRLGVPTSRRSQGGPCGDLGFIKALGSGSRPSWDLCAPKTAHLDPFGHQKERLQDKFGRQGQVPRLGAATLINRTSVCRQSPKAKKKKKALAGRLIGLGLGSTVRSIKMYGDAQALPRHMPTLDVLAPFPSILANLSLVSAR
jgi:hypothetical protein